MASVGVIVVGAGSGTRLGHEVPKAFVALLGRSILSRALDPIAAWAEAPQVVVVAPADRVDEARALVGTAGTVIAGGGTRQASVIAGLSALQASIEIVLVHDAARPLTPTAVFERVVAQIRATGDGVIPGVPVNDTLKTLDDGVATATVDRSLLSAVGTPQGFPRAALDAAYAAATEDYTDDAALFSAAGNTVRVIDGDARAFKITTLADLARAEALLQPTGERSSGETGTGETSTGEKSTGETSSGETRSGETRTGIGIDVHAFDATQPLWLGAVEWPGEPGLAGHSDGDAVAHAICDALLSAAGLGDIGARFGTADPRFADAHGEVFLRATVSLLADAGFAIRNVSVQVVGERPRMSARRAEVESTLTALVGAPVSVAATTSDGLGFTGRGEGVAAIATALVVRQ